MHGFADSPAGIALQIALSLLLISGAIYSAIGWVERQDPREIAPAPTAYFLGRFGWKPLVCLAFLLVAMPMYQKHHLCIVGVTHVVVVFLFWTHRMMTCAKWSQY